MARPDISLIITACDELELKPTVECAMDTRGSVDLEIIVVDDNSTNGCADHLPEGERIKVFHEHCYGVGMSRHFGLVCKTAHRSIVCDAHMKWRTGWLEKYVDAIDRYSPALITCVSAGYDWEPRPLYGCRWVFDKDPNNRNRPYFGLKWMEREPVQAESEVPALMGACYGHDDKTLEILPGYPYDTGYGQDEAFLSCGANLCGVPVILLRDVVAAHLYRSKEERPYPDAVCLKLNTRRIMHAFTQIMFDDLRVPIQRACFGQTFDDGILNDVQKIQKAKIVKNRKITDEEWLKQQGIYEAVMDEAKRNSTSIVVEKAKPILGFIRIMGRPEYTKATVKSLAMTDMAPDLELNAVVTPTPDLSIEDVRTLLDDSGFPDAEIIVTPEGEEGSGPSARIAFRLMQEEAKKGLRSRYVWFENDVIFRRDWYRRLLEFERQAMKFFKDQKDIGLLCPNHFDLPTYRPNWLPDPSMDGGGFWLKLRFASQCLVMSEQTVLALDMKAPYWDKVPMGWDEGLGINTARKGLMNICPAKSLVKHIGWDGLCWKRGHDWLPSIGFQPDEGCIEVMKELGIYEEETANAV